MNAKFINQKAARLRQGAIRAMFDQAASMQNVISMGIGEPDMPTPDPVCRAGIQAIEAGETHYTPNAGILSLREKIAEKSTVHKLGYDPMSEIIVTNGGMGALSLAMMVALEDGDEVILQNPQWLNYAKQVEYCGGAAVPVPVFANDGFTMQADAIEKCITKRSKAIVVNSPNNPTGAVVSHGMLKQIAQIAEKYDLLVISDEVYNTLVYDGIECASIAEFSEARDRTIVVNSFSKSFAMTGWRVGYAAGPANIIDRMVKLQENISACANAPGQYAAAFALDHPEISDELRDVFSKRRSILLDELKRIPGIVYRVPEGAFYIFADISAFGLSSEVFCNRLLREAGVVCIPGSAFGSCGEGFIRICYTNSDDHLREGMARLRNFCSSL